MFVTARESRVKHDILIAEMTVREQFQFFQRIKGLSQSEADQELIDLAEHCMLTQVNGSPDRSVRPNLVETLCFQKLDVRTCHLSGGMKRKLSLGIALSGNSKFLILDEPSSGVDAKSRRELWKILEKYKMGRTMLVSTHYMDEAEALSDKICIMAKGKLKYTGSCTDLKINRGRGYHLTISLPRRVFVSILDSDWLPRMVT